MSNSVWPHRRQPTRLLCPRTSLGKNTGVGCHFLLQHIATNLLKVRHSCSLTVSELEVRYFKINIIVLKSRCSWNCIPSRALRQCSKLNDDLQKEISTFQSPSIICISMAVTSHQSREPIEHLNMASPNWSTSVVWNTIR